MDTKFAIANVVPGKLNSLVKNLMRQMNITDPNEAVRRINSGEWIVSRKLHLREENGIIRFSVTSDGTSGVEWPARLEERGVHIGSHAMCILCSSEFRPTKGVTTEVALLKGMLIVEEEVDAKPSAEVACLIGDILTVEDMKNMGLKQIVVMHEPITGADDAPRFLCLSECPGGGLWLGADCDDPYGGCRYDHGFVFASSQVKSKSKKIDL
ncbi:MAG: hypothetical protein Q8O94_04635 [bacterium]|nr:hypothetical protein [bacterium]